MNRYRIIALIYAVLLFGGLLGSGEGIGVTISCLLYTSDAADE